MNQQATATSTAGFLYAVITDGYGHLIAENAAGQELARVTVHGEDEAAQLRGLITLARLTGVTPATPAPSQDDLNNRGFHFYSVLADDAGNVVAQDCDGEQLAAVALDGPGRVVHLAALFVLTRRAYDALYA